MENAPKSNQFLIQHMGVVQLNQPFYPAPLPDMAVGVYFFELTVLN